MYKENLHLLVKVIVRYFVEVYLAKIFPPRSDQNRSNAIIQFNLTAITIKYQLM